MNNPRDAEGTKEVASEDASGVAVDENKLTSEDVRSSASQQLNVSLADVDPATIFTIAPGVEMTASQVRDAVRDAGLARKFQSEVDVATKMRDEALERAATAETSLEAMQADQQLLERLERSGLLSDGKAVERDADPWALGETGEQQAIDAREVARLITEENQKTEQRLFDRLTEHQSKEIDNRLASEAERRQQEQQYEAFLNADARATAAGIKERYPNLSEDSVNEIIALKNAHQKAHNEAMMAAANGDTEVAIEKIRERDAIQRRQVNLEAEATVEQREAKLKTEQEQQLLTGEFAPVPEELEGDQERKPLMKAQESKARHASVAKWVGDRLEARQRAKNATGDL